MTAWLHIPTRVKLGVALAMVFLLLSSCSVERQLARDFLQAWTPPAIMLIPPPMVLKESLKEPIPLENEDITQYNLDSLRFARSVVLKEIDDSVFLDIHVNAFISGLRRYGYVVFTPSALDTFLAYPGEAYIFDMAQLLLEEYETPVTEKATFDETIYFKKFRLNTISISSWFELSRINVSEEMRELFYISHLISDFVSGRFSQHPLTGEVLFRYTQNPVDQTDAYDMAYTLGRKYASYLTDYFVNMEIARMLPEGVAPDAWYHLDPASGRLIKNWNDYFIRLEHD